MRWAEDEVETQWLIQESQFGKRASTLACCFYSFEFFLSVPVCVCPLKEKLMHIHSCKPTGTKSGHSSFNPMHFVNACVCVCICVCACLQGGM